MHHFHNNIIIYYISNPEFTKFSVPQLTLKISETFIFKYIHTILTHRIHINGGYQISDATFMTCGIQHAEFAGNRTVQVNIIEEQLSPFVIPFILMFVMRRRADRIVDFFRNFTVDIAGVGDVCSFAQMDIRRHGDPRASVIATCLGWVKLSAVFRS